jgi:hypothetical protein
MKTIGTVLGNIFGALLALALTAALGYYGYIAVKRFAVLFARLDFTVAMVTATATMAVLLAAMIIAGSIRRAGARQIAANLRVGKAEAYKLFISLWEDALQPGQTPEAIVQLSRRMQEVNHLLLLHGCTEVMKAHAAMQALDLQQARAKFADTLLAIRKDLGLESRGLDAKELVQLLLSPSEKAPSASRPGVHQDTQPRVSLIPN